jgi:nucleoside-diphosphate-sugar epimerase
MSTCVVTGVAGFLGSHLGERLIKEGHRVIGIDNFLTGRRNNIKDLFHEDKFTFIHHDISNPVEIDEHPDYIFHFASPASPVHYSWFPLETALVNSFGTKNLLDLAATYDTKFIMASTSEIYGDPLVHPQPESYWGNVNSIGPRSCYDEGKRFAETLSYIYQKQFGLDIAIIRIFNTYGPRMRIDDGRMISNFITQCLKGESITIYGDGKQTRSPCYVDDLIEGIYNVAFNLDQDNVVINLGSDEEISILELAGMINVLTNSDSSLIHTKLPKDDPTRRKPDLTLARKLIDFSPHYSLKEGLKKTIEWFRGNLDHSKSW